MYINKSLYTLEGYKAFLKLLYRKVKILSYTTAFLLIVIGVVLMFLQLNGYIYVVFGLSLPFFVNLVINSLENEAIKQNALLISATQQTFCFYEDKVTLIQTSRLGEFNDEYLYTEIFSVYKTKEYYFLFVNRTQALIVDIHGFIEGDEYTLDELFTSAIKEKFINKCKKK